MGHALAQRSQLVAASQESEFRMDVDVYKTGADDLPLGVDDALCRHSVEVADSGDLSCHDTDSRRKGARWRQCRQRFFRRE